MSFQKPRSAYCRNCIVAAEPKRVTKVLAELMGGELLPFPAVKDAYIAFANDALGTAIEVYPLKTTLEQGLGQEPVEFGQEIEQRYPSGVHVALKTPLSPDEIMFIGAREGWRTVSCSRGGYRALG